MNRYIKHLGFVVLALGATQAAHATLLTLDPGTGTTTTFTTAGGNGYDNPGPVVVNGITWTGSPEVTYGDADYFISSNGNWSTSPKFAWVATNNRTGSITASLGGGFRFVGGFMNYSPSTGTDATIQALGIDGTTVLETYDLVTQAPIQTPNGVNAGGFRGIQRASGDIYYFRLSGDYILTHTVETGGAAVPEPTTLALLGAAVLAAGAARRRTA